MGVAINMVDYPLNSIQGLKRMHLSPPPGPGELHGTNFTNLPNIANPADPD